MSDPSVCRQSDQSAGLNDSISGNDRCRVLPTGNSALLYQAIVSAAALEPL